MREPLVSFHSPEELRHVLWPQIWPPHDWPDLVPDLFHTLADKTLPPLVSIRDGCHSGRESEIDHGDE